MLAVSVEAALKTGATTDGQTSRNKFVERLEIRRRQLSRLSFRADNAR